MLRAFENGYNCLIEGPTGMGKTLAITAGSLAYLQHLE
jgi:Rad3-related DNA helicase